MISVLRLWAVAVFLPVAVLTNSASAASYDGLLTIKVVDDHTGGPLAARMELRNARGKPVRVRPEGAIVLDGYLVFDGAVTLPLKRGQYQFAIEAGPEFQTRSGQFTIDRNAEDTTEVRLERRVNMRSEGWWAADLDVSQKLSDLPLLMRAAAVDFVPVTAVANVQGRCRELKPAELKPVSALSPPLFGPWAAFEYRRGGGLLLLGDNLPKLCDHKADDTSLAVLHPARESGCLPVALNPYSWDLPLWVATGKLAAVQVIHRNALVDAVVDKEEHGLPRDRKFFPGPQGNGRWSEAVYFHLLNCGLHLPPAAGSGSGTNSNPVGTNRVYAFCQGEFSREAWLTALQAGRVMVTNGPLLRTTVEGQPPGAVFPLAANTPHEFQIALKLSYYERAQVDYLEIIQNGEPIHQIRLAELAEKQGRLPPVPCSASGWFAVRVVTNNMKNYQFALTAPYYVEVNHTPRISRRSVQFFLNWLDTAANEFADNSPVVKEIDAARPFWQGLLSKANADLPTNRP